MADLLWMNLRISRIVLEFVISLIKSFCIIWVNGCGFIIIWTFFGVLGVLGDVTFSFGGLWKLCF